MDIARNGSEMKRGADTSDQCRTTPPESSRASVDRRDVPVISPNLAETRKSLRYKAALAIPLSLLCVYLVGCGQQVSWLSLRSIREWSVAAGRYAWKTNQRTAQLESLWISPDGRAWAVGAAGLIETSADGGSSWVGIPSNTGTHLHAITGAADGSIMWIVGGEEARDGGVLLNSENSGRTWQQLSLPDDTCLHSIYIDGNGVDIWISGDRGAVFYSHDRGKHWDKLTTGSDQTLLWILSDAGQSLVLAGGVGGMFRSSDGGRSWQKVDLGNGLSIRTYAVVHDAAMRRFWISGDDGAVLYSEDSGANWKRLNSPTHLSLFSIVGSPEQSRFVAVGERGVILWSLDGQSWSEGPVLTSYKLLSVYQVPSSGEFLSVGEGDTVLGSPDLRGWRLLGDTNQPRSDQSVVRVSADGRVIVTIGPHHQVVRREQGKPWVSATLPSTGGLNALWLSPDGHAALVGGENGDFFITSDGGKTWSHTPTGLKQEINDIAASSDLGIIWAVADEGRVAVSRNRGVTWASQTLAPGEFLNGISMSAEGTEAVITTNVGDVFVLHGPATWKRVHTAFDDTLGGIAASRDGSLMFAAGNGGLILKSTTHGETWRGVRTGATVDLQTVFCTENGSMVWAVGDDTKGNNALMFSSDEGTSWLSLNAKSYGYFAWITGTPNGSRLIASTAAGLLESHDQGKTWNVILPSDGSETRKLTAMFGTSDGMSIWGVGDGGFIARTTDGGISWRQEQSPSDEDLVAIAGRDDGSKLWTIGRNGTILASDGQGKWQPQTSHTDQDLHALYKSPTGRLWAVGDQIILVSDDGESWTPFGFRSTPTLRTYSFWSIAGSQDGQTLWLGASQGYVFKSTDAGGNWKTAGPSSTETANALLVSPDGSRVLVGKDDGAIFRTTNKGDYWTILSTSSNPIRSLSLASTTGEIWAVGDNGTLLYSADDGLSWNTTGLGTRDDLSALFVESTGTKVVISGENGIVLRGTRVGQYSTVTGLRIVPHPFDLQLELQLTPDSVYSFTPLKDVDLWATTDANASQRSLQKLKVISSKAGKEAGAWNIEFEPGGLNLSSGQDVFMELAFRTTDLRRTIFLPRQRIDPWRWARDHLAVVLSCLGFLLYVCAMVTLLLVRPLWLISIRRSGAINALADSINVPVIGPLLKNLAKITLLRYFVTHKLTLNAWVAEKLRYLRSNNSKWGVLISQPHATEVPRQGSDQSVALDWTYVRLPITIEQNGERRMVREPSPGELPEIFVNRPYVLEILGPGGSGKSTLARQIAAWFSEDGIVTKHWPVLPVMIDDECTELKSVLTGRLLGAFGEQVEDDFLDALLKNGRLIVIVDGLSERRSETRQYFTNIHQHLTLRSIMITSRTRFEFPGYAQTIAAPQPLDSSTLLSLMVALLDEFRRKELDRTTSSPEGLGIVEQLHLGKQLAQLTNIAGGGGIPITPLLVKLYVEKAVSLYATGTSLDELPSSVPDVYFDYLRLVNPKAPDTSEPSVANWLPDELMLRIVRILAKLALAEILRPGQWFVEHEARAAIAECSSLLHAAADPLKRLVDNGVLQLRSLGAEVIFGFTLDPVAEFAAAYQYAVENGAERERWALFEERVKNLPVVPTGFLSALSITIRAYGMHLGWRPTEFFEQDRPT
jgi:photosystem II stability/assembly factor-like uncharacterized protein